MRSRLKVGLAFTGMVLSNLCAMLGLVFYVLEHPRDLVPRWIPISMVCFFILTFLGYWGTVRRSAQKMANEETSEQRVQRRRWIAVGLKFGLVFYIVALLNGILLIMEHELPLKYAGVGLTVDILLILGFWKSLRKLQQLELDDHASLGSSPQ